MNISVIVAFASLITVSTSGKKHAKMVEKYSQKNRTETLEKFDFSARTITECSKSSCIQGSIEKIRAMKSYLLIYRNSNSWILEKDPVKRDSVVSNYKIKQISIGTGNVSVNEKAITEEHIVVLN